MTQPKQKKSKSQVNRPRGVILTSQGLQRLKEARLEAEYRENKGNRYTLEALSARTQCSVDTLMKVFAAEFKVDKNTLISCFNAFDLRLELSDYSIPQLQPHPEKLPEVEPEFPDGEVALKSVFYVERWPIESDCYKAILQPGALIRLKAPRRRGKTSLLRRMLNHAEKEKCHPVFLSFRLTDNLMFQDLDKFLQSFCANVSLALKLPNKVIDYWDNLFGSKMSCKIYFEEYLLAKINQPIVLGLDDVDILCQYPDLANDFFSLLRAWHEEAKNKDIWKKLRLIVVHSTQISTSLNVNQSPFNVGLPIELPEFTVQQIEDLAQRYKLDLSSKEIHQLMSLVGGAPHLIRLALYHLWGKNITLTELLDFSSNSVTSVYGNHLQQQLCNLQTRNSGLVDGFAKVVMAKEPVDMDLIQAFELESLGLVSFQGNQVIPSCELYAQYFRDYFNGGL